MEKKIHPLRFRLRTLLGGIMVILFLTATSYAQENLASAKEVVFNKPQNRLDIPINISLQNANVDQLLTAIEQKSGFQFVYDKSILEYKGNFTIDEERISLYKFLEWVSEKSALRFKQVNNNINVRLEKKTKETQKEEYVSIKGAVVDEAKNPLPGVSVLIKGTSSGTITDLDGNFVLEASDDDILVFSYMGFVTQEVPVEGRSVITVTLLENVEALGEVVVTALGIKRDAKKVGYATATVDTDQLLSNRSPNLGNNLIGKVAGLTVQDRKSVV